MGKRILWQQKSFRNNVAHKLKLIQTTFLKVHFSLPYWLSTFVINNMGRNNWGLKALRNSGYRL